MHLMVTYRVRLCGSCFLSLWEITRTIKLTVLIYNLMPLSISRVLGSHYHHTSPEPFFFFLIPEKSASFFYADSITPPNVPAHDIVSPQEDTMAKTGSLSHAAGRRLIYRPRDHGQTISIPMVFPSTAKPGSPGVTVSTDRGQERNVTTDLTQKLGFQC